VRIRAPYYRPEAPACELFLDHKPFNSAARMSLLGACQECPEPALFTKSVYEKLSSGLSLASFLSLEKRHGKQAEISRHFHASGVLAEGSGAGS
jgi:hypothetical protein